MANWCLEFQVVDMEWPGPLQRKEGKKYYFDEIQYNLFVRNSLEIISCWFLLNEPTSPFAVERLRKNTF